MKNFLTFTILALVVAGPALAADPSRSHRMPSTDGKQYRADTSAQTEVDAQAAENLQNITPAAGDAEIPADSRAEGQKSFKEEMRLPRKN